MPFTVTTLAALRARLQDKWEITPFWTDEDARLAINEAMYMWNLLTGTWRKRHTITVFPDDAYLPLPAPLTYPLRTTFNNVPLRKTSRFQLDHGRDGWEGEHVGDANIPPRPWVWAPIDIQLIAIWPHLKDTDTGTLVFDGIAITPVLVNDGDFIDVDASVIEPLLGEALYIASFKAGATVMAMTKPLHAEFIQAAVTENERLAASQLYRKAQGLKPDEEPVK